MTLGQRFRGKQNNGIQSQVEVWHGKCPVLDAIRYQAGRDIAFYVSVDGMDQP
jgi:hypothetical protein